MTDALTPSRPALALIAVAGLYGALGVATAAAASHGSGDPRLVIASNFVLLHAAAILGATAAAGAFRAPLLLAPASALALGALLFCGDLLVRVRFDQSPLPFIAPVGGTLLIVGWLGVAVGAALLAVRRARI